MEQIIQYQRLSEVKPRYYKVEIPYHKPSIKRIRFNLKETQLYYDHDKGVYSETEPAKKGGSSNSIIYVSDMESLLN